MHRKKWTAVVVSLVLAGCSSSSTSSGSKVGGGGDGGSDGASSNSTSNPTTCADWGGTCSQTACSGGLHLVRDGGDSLCTGAVAVCCVPGNAGSRVVKGTDGLLCTSSSFSEFGKGTCAGAPCAVGGECRDDGAGATCDTSRGLPATKDGTVECAIFGCGSITCAVGCSCSDAASSACSCP